MDEVMEPDVEVDFDEEAAEAAVEQAAESIVPSAAEQVEGIKERIAANEAEHDALLAELAEAEARLEALGG